MRATQPWRMVPLPITICRQVTVDRYRVRSVRPASPAGTECASALKENWSPHRRDSSSAWGSEGVAFLAQIAAATLSHSPMPISG